jgi:hypothetical protein
MSICIDGLVESSVGVVSVREERNLGSDTEHVVGDACGDATAFLQVGLSDGEGSVEALTGLTLGSREDAVGRVGDGVCALVQLR